MTITADGIEKSFNGFPALRGVSLAVEPGEFITVAGPSGWRKSAHRVLRLADGRLDA